MNKIAKYAKLAYDGVKEVPRPILTGLMTLIILASGCHVPKDNRFSNVHSIKEENPVVQEVKELSEEEMDQILSAKQFLEYNVAQNAVSYMYMTLALADGTVDHRKEITSNVIRQVINREYSLIENAELVRDVCKIADKDGNNFINKDEAKKFFFTLLQYKRSKYLER